jgi:hypothetical protein
MYWSGTEKFPPPSGYLAAKPQPTKTGGRSELMDQEIRESGTDGDECAEISDASQDLQAKQQ